MRTCCRIIAGGLLAIGASFPARAQGNIEPPGPPGSAAAWMKPLNMVEPRIVITNLPCLITNSGSYCLVSNLYGRSGSPGISIQTNDVKLDLNGFALIGVGGSFSGIYIDGTSLGNITIQNGVVRGWWGFGVHGVNGRGIQVTGLRTYANTTNGMFLGSSCLIRECVSVENGGCGMEIGGNAVVSDCEARNNVLTGIALGPGSKLSGCVATDNSAHGIACSSNCVIQSCLVLKNKIDGIRFTDSCRVLDNNSSGNGTGTANGAGIRAMGRYSRIQDNNVTLNDYGIVTELGGNLVVRNAAGGNSESNYGLHSDTIAGTIPLQSDRLDFDKVTGRPWANFEY